MSRPFQGVSFTLQTALSLREAIRPLYILPGGSDTFALSFCARLYLGIQALEADSDLDWIHLPLSVPEIFLLNQYLSQEDGEWAADLLHQSRQALFEHHTGKEAVRLASQAEVEALFVTKPVEVAIITEEKPHDPSHLDDN